ncbi:MAG: DUF1772 domain-containing protein [Steroidobacteraceae bacterium]
MLALMQVFTLLLVAIAVSCAVAHALELPGKLRLSEETYRAVQPIYYPGFTIAGAVGEFGGLIATVVLALITPRGTLAFWLTLWALIALALMQLVFWLFTQPVNQFWVRDVKLHGTADAFFRLRFEQRQPRSPDWRSLRNQWEYSHVARAVLSLAALILLASTIAAT